MGPIKKVDRIFVLADGLDHLLERTFNFISLNGFYTNDEVRENKRIEHEKDIAELAVLHKQLSLKETKMYHDLMNQRK